MNLYLIKRACEAYLISADCSDSERSQLFHILEEFGAILERREYLDDWHTTGTFICYPILTDILNELTYDIYGKQARVRHGNVPFEYYAYDCRKHSFWLCNLTNNQLRVGYDLLSDLWNDNEQNDSHNSDGTFKRSDT